MKHQDSGERKIQIASTRLKVKAFVAQRADWRSRLDVNLGYCARYYGAKPVEPDELAAVVAYLIGLLNDPFPL
jgi:hypothetical protein